MHHRLWCVVVLLIRWVRILVSFGGNHGIIIPQMKLQRVIIGPVILDEKGSIVPRRIRSVSSTRR
jgi:hypothetical protein